MVDLAAVPVDIWPVLWPVIVGGTLTLIAPAVGFLWTRLSERRNAKVDAAHVALCAALALERFAVTCWPVSYSGRDHTERTGQPTRQDLPALEDMPASSEWKGMDIGLADAVMSFHNRIDAAEVMAAHAHVYENIRHHLADCASVEADALRRGLLETIGVGELGNGSEGLAKTGQAIAQDPAAGLLVRQRDRQDEVAPRGECRIDSFGEIAGGDEQKIGVSFRQCIELDQYGIGGAVDVDGIGFEAHLGAISRQSLHLVEQDDGGPVGRRLGDRLREELGHRFLGLAHGGARQGVRVYLQQLEVTALERLCRPVGQAARERGLAGARWPH